MKGYLVIDDVSLDEAREILRTLGKKGRWIPLSGMRELGSAAGSSWIFYYLLLMR